MIRPIGVGGNVYVRNRGFTGHHKLQDIWYSSKFRVTNVHDSVYTVQSGDCLQKTLNRRDIKRCPSHPHLPVQDTGQNHIVASLRRSQRLRARQEGMWDSRWKKD